MEKLFESKFMIKLQEFGQALGSNKFLSSLQGAMMSLMGVIMVGAVFQIICAVAGIFGWFTSADPIYAILYSPYNYTMNMLSLWLVLLLGFNYAKTLKLKSPTISAVNAIVCFLLSAAPITGTSLPTDYLSATGMFVGFIVVFITVNIEKFCMDKGIRIKMPDVVPPFLQDGFSSILPLLFSVILFLVLSTAVSTLTAGQLNLASGFIILLGAPLGVLASVPGMFVLGIFAALLWCFGIHGTMVLIPILMPIMMQAATANATAYAMGEPLQFYATSLFGCIAMCGGSGNTMGLAILGSRSKSKQISAVAKISLVPGWFGINEPMTFGMPIMYNPILCIPFILTVPVVMGLTLFAYSIGFLRPAHIAIMSLLPMGVGAFFGTLRWQNAIWDYLMLIPTTLIWYPFFKAYEKQLVAKEAEQEALEAAEAAKA